MEYLNYRLILTILASVVVGCSTQSTVRETLLEHPEYVAEAMEKNPDVFAKALAALSESGKRFSARQRSEEMRRDVEEDLRNPKTVPIEPGRAVLGKLDAPIVLVEFSDFQCPFCRKGFETVDVLRKKYGEKLLFVYKHLPLPMHPLALPAAKRFEAIAMQSSTKAYQFHDRVFRRQDELKKDGEAFLDSVAKGLDVDMARLKKDMESDAVRARIESDSNQARDLGFQGTPGFVVAGVRVKGARPASTFDEIIERKLAGAPAPAAPAESSAGPTN